MFVCGTCLGKKKSSNLGCLFIHAFRAEVARLITRIDGGFDFPA